MPSSYAHNIPALVEAIDKVSPLSVYDVGTGFGKYGFLIREYFDNFDRNIRIDGCEIYQPYLDRSPASSIYDSIQVEDWLTLTPPLPVYDLVLMIDVLEHFTVDDGTRALKKALSLSPNVLVSTPLNYAQDAMYGNRYEAHLSEWRPVVFASQGFQFRTIVFDELSVIGWVYA